MPALSVGGHTSGGRAGPCGSCRGPSRAWAFPPEGQECEGPRSGLVGDSWTSPEPRLWLWSWPELGSPPARTGTMWASRASQGWTWDSGGPSLSPPAPCRPRQAHEASSGGILGWGPLRPSLLSEGCLSGCHLPQGCCWPSWRGVGPSPKSRQWTGAGWGLARWPPATRTSSSASRCSSLPLPCAMPSPARCTRRRRTARQVCGPATGGGGPAVPGRAPLGLAWRGHPPSLAPSIPLHPVLRAGLGSAAPMGR